MGVLAAEYRFFLLILSASLAVGVFFLSADQLPGAVAPGGMHVLRIGIGAGRRPGVHRLRHRLKAGVGVLMLQNLNLFAYQFAVSVKAVGRVTVEDDLRFRADQHRLSIRGQVADQNRLPFIAVVAVLVIAFRTAGQLPVGFIAAVTVVMAFRGFELAHGLPVFILTAFAVLVALAFLQAAGKHGGLGVAGIRMDMLLADQIALHRRIAALRVGMSFQQGIAVGSVLVCLNLGKRAPPHSVLVIAS